MRKTLSIFLAVMLVMTFAAPIYAAGVDKAKSGAEMLVKSPLQVYDHIKGEYDSTGLNPLGLMGGVLKGMYYMSKDVIHGAVDILTFPVDL